MKSDVLMPSHPALVLTSHCVKLAIIFYKTSDILCCTFCCAGCEPCSWYVFTCLEICFDPQV